MLCSRYNLALVAIHGFITDDFIAHGLGSVVSNLPHGYIAKVNYFPSLRLFLKTAAVNITAGVNVSNGNAELITDRAQGKRGRGFNKTIDVKLGV